MPLQPVRPCAGESDSRGIWKSFSEQIFIKYHFLGGGRATRASELVALCNYRLGAAPRRPLCVVKATVTQPTPTTTQRGDSMHNHAGSCMASNSYPHARTLTHCARVARVPCPVPARVRP
jgi:hypothetical protein